MDGYCAFTQMFKEDAKLDADRLRFMRWLAEHGKLREDMWPSAIMVPPIGDDVVTFIPWMP